MKREAPFAVALVLVAVWGCGSPAPPSPSSAFTPDLVGVATRVEALSCGLSRVTLDSGDHIDLVMTGSSINDATPCPVSTLEPSRLLFGPDAAQAATDHLFLAGHDAVSDPWYAWAAQRSEGASCDPGTYMIAGGAFEEGDSFHLSNGLRLATSPSYAGKSTSAPKKSGTPAIVASDGWLCVDAHGLVVSVGGPAYL